MYRALGVALRTKQLRAVDLSDNAVGTKGIEACREFLSGQTGLEELTFSNCGLSAEACRAVSDVLLFRTPTRLRLLHFNNNMSGSGGGIAIADVVQASCDLLDLRFSSSRCGSEGALAFAAALPYAPRLKRIDLSDNTFNARGLAAISASLSGLAWLEEINLSDTAAGDQGIKSLTTALASSKCAATLRSLHIASNEITEVGARMVASSLKHFESLELLDLSGNELGSRGIRVVARGLEQRHSHRRVAGTSASDPLTVLILEGNDSGTQAALALARAVVSSLPALATLRLAENGISEAGASELREILSSAGMAGALVEFDADGDDEESADDDGEYVSVRTASIVVFYLRFFLPQLMQLRKRRGTTICLLLRVIAPR